MLMGILLEISGAALLTTGLFLPWLEMGRRIGTGFQRLGYFAPIMAVLSVLIIAAALFSWRTRKPLPVMLLVLDLAAFGAVFLCFIKLRHLIQKTAFLKNAPTFGIGFYTSMSGALLALAGVLVLFTILKTGNGVFSPENSRD